MDQQEDQRRVNRHVSRTQRNNVQRRNIVVQRRNVVHYRVQNIAGNVIIANNYYFDINVARSNPTPRPLNHVATSSQQLPIIVYGPNQSNPNSGNVQAYLAVPPVSHIPRPATHIAIPLSSVRFAHDFSGSASASASAPPRPFNNVRPSNGNVIGPRFATVGPSGTMNNAAQAFGPFPPPEVAHAPVRLTSPNVFGVTSNDNFVAVPSIIVPSYVNIPTRTQTYSFSYSNTLRITPPSFPIPNGARILPVENVPSVEEVDSLEITEVVSSTVDEELN